MNPINTADKIEKIKIDKKTILGAIFTGLLLTASFPGIGYSLLAWVSLVPLLFSLRHLNLRNAFITGFAAGFVHYITLLYWLVPTMKDYGHLPLIVSVAILLLLASYLSLYIAMFSLALNFISRKKHYYLVFSIPFLWVAFEYVRSFLFSGFPWGLMGYSQFNMLNLIQISDIFGVFGLSFLIALSNASVFLIILYFAEKGFEKNKTLAYSALVSGGVTVLCVFSVLFYGHAKIKKIDWLLFEAPVKKISLIQGNVDQSLKWDPSYQKATVKKYLDLSYTANEERPELIIWPETATPFYFLHKYEKKLSRMVKKGIQKTGAYFLIGSPASVISDQKELFLNSAYLLNPSGKNIGRYDKVHLVPYGEYIPLKKWFPFLKKIVPGIGGFSSGKKGSTLLWQDVRLGVQICFEIIFPDLARAAALNGANLFVNITNDAWFGKTSAPYQHLSMTVFRAVENRKALVRCANTGISCFIDPAGRITASTELFKDTFLTGDIPIVETETTLYTHFGDAFALACLVFSLVLAIFSYFIKTG